MQDMATPAPGYCGNITPATFDKFLLDRGWWVNRAHNDTRTKVYICWDIGMEGRDSVKQDYITVPQMMENDRYPFEALQAIEVIAANENVESIGIYNALLALQQKDIFEASYIFNQYNLTDDEFGRLIERRDRARAIAAVEAAE